MNVIIGTGPAGISAAYHLHQRGEPYFLIDRQKRIGGLCQSFTLANATFDIGGHAFFTKHTYVRDLLEKIAFEPFYKQSRSAWVYSHNVYIPYPFQANLYGLPQEVIEECLIGLVDVVKTPSISPPQNIQEWIYQSFGEGIAKHFMIPYNEKIWAHPLDIVSPNWASDRIIEPDYKSIISGALYRKDFRNYPNAVVTYPGKGGYERIVEYLAYDLDLKNNFIEGEVSSIDVNNHTLTLSGGQTFSYTNLISTIPLNELVQKTIEVEYPVITAAQKLKAFSLYLVNLVVKRHPTSTDMQRIYCANPEVPFHKLVMNANSSQSLREEGLFTYQAEVSFSSYKQIQKNNLEQQVIEALQKMNLLKVNESILASSLIEVPLAYPVYTSDWLTARQTIFSYFEPHGVICAGRFGEWLYINADDAIMHGKIAADKIIQGNNP